jgi:universal stress protein A
MNPIHRILVPIDLSPGCEDALLSAMSLASSLGAEVDVLHVHEAPTFAGPDLEGHPLTRPFCEEEQTIADELRTRVTRFVRSVTGAEAPGLTIHEVTGEPSKKIVETAEALGSDLIVVGTHGGGRLKHLVTGSVAERVVRLASCPVLTVRLAGRQAAA